MITEAPQDARPTRIPDETPATVGRGATRPRPSRSVPVLMALCAALIAFNAWWYWRDTRDVASTAAIEAMMNRQQYARAESSLRERLRRSSRDVEARLLLARTLGAGGDTIGCARQLHEVPAWSPEKPEAVFREGQSYLMADRAKDAEACWLGLVEDDPLHPTPPEILGAASQQLLGLYATENRWEDAARVIWETYDRAGPDDRLALLSMRVKSELERIAPEAAMPILERYVAADPTDWEALRARARAEIALGRKEDAERDFRACIAGRPEDARAWRDYLSMLHDLGDEAAWAALLAKVPASAADEPEIWRFRGLAKEKVGDWAGAAADYRKALELNPYVMASQYRLAMMEERQGDRTAAAEHRKAADSLREARGALRVAFGQMLIAQEAAEKNQQSTPDLPTAMRRLGAICGTLGFGRLQEAFNMLADRS
ncbi:tetratricopeptide repeat protein [Aquisphaera insulae]|uniref:tetratricopeptide repeat protein n=1 Tax=Aquisphaera insulae TaxID=2712864 RepID=UPI0013EB1532|nr:tetratricopeptide repeat protein [Aquisphaera insulae]